MLARFLALLAAPLMGQGELRTPGMPATPNSSLSLRVNEDAQEVEEALLNGNATYSQNRAILKYGFCQTYYQGTSKACASLVSKVVSDKSLPAPVITLGDPSKTPMVFLHGWPDNPALWANQFEYFCGVPNASYYCVAPSVVNYEPDLAAYNSKIDTGSIPVTTNFSVYLEQVIPFASKQASLLNQTFKAMNLKDIVLVVFDFGAGLGQVLWNAQPELFKAIIAIQNGPAATLETRPSYFQVNLATCYGTATTSDWSEYLSCRQNTSLWDYRASAPTVSYQPQSAWIYNLVPVGPDAIAALGPLNQTMATYLPPGLPYLFLYGRCAASTGCPSCVNPTCLPRDDSTQDLPCLPTNASLYYADEWIPYVQSRPKSKAVSVSAFKWLMLDQAADVNQQISGFLGSIASERPNMLI